MTAKTLKTLMEATIYQKMAIIRFLEPYAKSHDVDVYLLLDAPENGWITMTITRGHGEKKLSYTCGISPEGNIHT